MAERPTPVRRRATNKLAAFQTNAFNSENPEYHIVVTRSARFRPTRSENHPPVVAPTNMPTNDAEITPLVVVIESCQASRMAGAANAKLFRSPSSKKKMYPSSATMRRWKEAIGKRSSRDATDIRLATPSTGHLLRCNSLISAADS